MLVHKLKTSITTLLNGRSREGRFVAIGLVKAAVDVGGWETLRGSAAWVSGLLSIVQVWHSHLSNGYINLLFKKSNQDYRKETLQLPKSWLL
jgi:hypothetical protein